MNRLHTITTLAEASADDLIHHPTAPVFADESVTTIGRQTERLERRFTATSGSSVLLDYGSKNTTVVAFGTPR